MVIIDEYDNFTSNLLMQDPLPSADLARLEGDVGAFYRVLRYFNQSEVIERIILTGVLPVSLDTSLSGFVCKNVSGKPALNGVAGFTRSKIMDLLRETIDFEKCVPIPRKLSWA